VVATKKEGTKGSHSIKTIRRVVQTKLVIKNKVIVNQNKST
jgi:hypothetical protein